MLLYDLVNSDLVTTFTFHTDTPASFYSNVVPVAVVIRCTIGAHILKLLEQKAD